MIWSTKLLDRLSSSLLKTKSSKLAAKLQQCVTKVYPVRSSCLRRFATTGSASHCIVDKAALSSVMSLAVVALFFSRIVL